MPDLLVRNLPQETVDSLKERAKRNHRSLQGEAADILTREATVSRIDFLSSTRALRKKIGKEFPKQTNSVDLLREDRGR